MSRRLTALLLSGTCLLAGCASPGGSPEAAPDRSPAASVAPSGPVLGPLAPATASAAPSDTGTDADAGTDAGTVPSAPPSAAVATIGEPTDAPSRPVLGGGDAADAAGGSATPAPDWLGTRPLAEAGSGPVSPRTTPPELVDRRIRTVDRLPAPPDGTFRFSVSEVPDDVLARSTWRPECPVGVADLRYVQVSFWGFDDRPHTGELLLHADAVDAVVGAFEAMHEARFPLEEVRVVAAEELDAAPTGDGNVTSAFVCRPAVGSDDWSEHAYGRAVDVNPFHNPYVKGRGDDAVVIPELATSYAERREVLPGMVTAGSAPVEAFRRAGWVWGGGYRTLKDWQHFSATGG